MKKQVKVKPHSKQQKIEEAADGSLTIHLKSPPVEGKANEELIKLLAEKFNTKSELTTPFILFLFFLLSSRFSRLCGSFKKGVKEADLV